MKNAVESYTSWGTSEAWRVHRWQLACFLLVLGDTKNRNDGSGQSYDAWPLDTWLDSPIFRCLRETFLPMLVNEPVEYPKPEHDDKSSEALLPEQDRNEHALPGGPPPEEAVLFCPLPGRVPHLKCWQTKYFTYQVDIVHMYAEMGNDEHTEMQLKLPDSQNPSVFVTTTKVGGTGLDRFAGNHAVITQKLWVLNELWQEFRWVVQLGQNRVPHTWLLNAAPGGYNNCMSNLHQHSAVAQMRVLHILMSWPNVTTTMIFHILESLEDHTMPLAENWNMLQSDEPSS